jgi:hypothetical protein
MSEQGCPVCQNKVALCVRTRLPWASEQGCPGRQNKVALDVSVRRGNEERGVSVGKIDEAVAQGLAMLHECRRASAKDFPCISVARCGIMRSAVEKPASLSATTDEASDAGPSKR